MTGTSHSELRDRIAGTKEKLGLPDVQQDAAERAADETDRTALGTELGEADWWRLLDALLLVATLPRS